MKKLFTLFILCLFTFISQAQTYVGDITLLSQEDVDNFSTNYPGITYVEGEVYILGTSPITNLSGLSQLSGARDLQIWDSGLLGWIPSQGDSLTIFYSVMPPDPSSFTLQAFTSGYTSLEYLRFTNFTYDSFPGFEFFQNLTNVGTFEFESYPPTFEAIIPNLSTVETINYLIGGEATSPLYLPSVNSLNNLFCSDIDGFNLTQNSTPIFSSLHHIEYFLGFQLGALDGFIGLSSLTSVGTFKTLESYTISNLQGLSNIQNADVIEIDSYNNNFDSQPLSGLESLETIRRFTIYFGYAEGDLSTLSNLQSVDSLMIGYPIGNFSLPGPAGLTSLQGIENATINDYLSISAPDLSFCSVPSVCNFLSSHGPEDYFIDATNPFGCASDDEILASCGDPANSTIFGSIYFDSNCNGLVDDNELTISPSYITVTPPNNTLIGLSSFLTNVAPQTTITLSAANLPSQYVVGTPLSITTPEFGGIINNQNILVCPAFDFNDLRISILQFGNLSPGFTQAWKLKVDNLGTSTVDFIPSLTFNTPVFVAFVNAIEGTFVNNVISWAAVTISPGQTLEFDFTITLIPTATILGETFSASASVALVSGTDENPSDNTALFEQEIIGSYDPNDKMVNTPQINIETIDPTQPLDLTYRVRFQNTGTAPAVNVRVEDILEEDLDPSTFQLLSSTHEVYYQIEGNQINFFFNDIMLPDSTSDPEGSIGTFFFRIKSNGNHTLESIIDNQVSIFFDFNEPIITNVASTIFYNCPVVDIAGESVSLCAGEELELSAVASNNTSIQWFVNEEQVSSSDSYSFTSDTPNDYSVLVVAENEYCIDEDELEITVNENPEVTLVLDGTTLVATEGFASYQWTLDGNIIEGENGNIISSPAVGNYVVSVTNEFGCSDQSDAVEVVIGINELVNDPIVLWPNPANDVLNIQTAYRGIITMIDMQGKQVMNFTMNGQASLDISSLPTGIYQITGSSGLLGQFIKE